MDSLLLHRTARRVATRYLRAAFFDPGDVILYGKYKNKRGRIVGFGRDHKGNPLVEIEPIPKGRKQNKVFGLYRIWHDPMTPKGVEQMQYAVPREVETEV